MFPEHTESTRVAANSSVATVAVAKKTTNKEVDFIDAIVMVSRLMMTVGVGSHAEEIQLR